MRLDILKAVLLILVFLLTAPVFAAGGDLRDMEDSLRNDPANPEIAINVALGYCDGGEMARCLDAMAYVIALDPSYVSQCKKYLERYGYSLNEDELREDSVGEAVDMIDAEIQLFRYDRMREPDDKDIEKILSKSPFNVLKNPYTGRSIFMQDDWGGDVEIIIIPLNEGGVMVKGYKRIRMKGDRKEVLERSGKITKGGALWQK